MPDCVKDGWETATPGRACQGSFLKCSRDRVAQVLVISAVDDDMDTTTIMQSTVHKRSTDFIEVCVVLIFQHKI